MRVCVQDIGHLIHDDWWCSLDSLIYLEILHAVNEHAIRRHPNHPIHRYLLFALYFFLHTHHRSGALSVCGLICACSTRTKWIKWKFMQVKWISGTFNKWMIWRHAIRSAHTNWFTLVWVWCDCLPSLCCIIIKFSNFHTMSRVMKFIEKIALYIFRLIEALHNKGKHRTWYKVYNIHYTMTPCYIITKIYRLFT